MILTFLGLLYYKRELVKQKLQKLVQELYKRSPTTKILLRYLSIPFVLFILRCFLLFYRRRYHAIKIKERTVLITGAGSGIGKGMALECVKRGASLLVLLDINPKSLEEMKEEIGEKAEVLTYVCDVSSDQHVASVAVDVQEDLKKLKGDSAHIDILINNAGIVVGKPLLELTPRDVQKTISVNTLGLFYMLQNYLPGMIEYTKEKTQKGVPRSGCIVTIASTMGMFTAGGLSDYCASKFAAIGMHEAMRMELRESAPHLRTLLVCPYGISTGMFAGLSSANTWGLRIQKLILPMLEPDYVVQQTINGIEHGEKWLVFPVLLRFLPYIFRFLPPEVNDFLTDLMGGNDSMKGFVGRQPVRN